MKSTRLTESHKLKNTLLKMMMLNTQEMPYHFVNERGAKLLFTRGSVAGRIEPIQGKIKPEHLTPSPHNQTKANIRVGDSSSDEATVPLSLFSTFTNAGIE